MNTHKEPKLIEIFSGNAWEVDLLRSILADAQIKSYCKDNLMGTIAPHYTAGGVGAVKLCISSADIERVKPYVEAFNKNR